MSRQTREPTIMQRFFAQDWPCRIWLGACSVASAAIAGNACNPTAASFRNWGFAIRFGIVVICFSAIGYLAGAIYAWRVVGPFYRLRAEFNGAPFKEGDHVQILSGVHYGKIGRVYGAVADLSVGDNVWVELGPEAKNDGSDRFTSVEVAKVKVPE